jgi:release factor glutamine methyltransferase
MINSLDTEILLAYVLQVSRSYLHTHPEKILSEQEQNKFFELVKRREQGEPIAYLVGTQEFWSLPFEVNAHTLVPRPETELLVEVGLQVLPIPTLDKPNQLVADLGTGSGAIAVALAHELIPLLLHSVMLSAYIYPI